MGPMKGWKTKNQPKDPFESTWDWIARKDPDYCRPHGRRILVFLNGAGGCRKCVELAIDQIKKRLPPDHPLKLED
jgi:hypothetical protein